MLLGSHFRPRIWLGSWLSDHVFLITPVVLDKDYETWSVRLWLWSWLIFRASAGPSQSQIQYVMFPEYHKSFCVHYKVILAAVSRLLCLTLCSRKKWGKVGEFIIVISTRQLYISVEYETNYCMFQHELPFVTMPLFMSPSLDGCTIKVLLSWCVSTLLFDSDGYRPPWRKLLILLTSLRTNEAMNSCWQGQWMRRTAELFSLFYTARHIYFGS